MTALLECTACKEAMPYRIEAEQAESVPLPAHIPDLATLSLGEEQLLAIVEAVTQNRMRSQNQKELSLDINEADVYEFCSNQSEESTETIKSLLFGVDIVKGMLICRHCDNKLNIRNGILYCQE